MSDHFLDRFTQIDEMISQLNESVTYLHDVIEHQFLSQNQSLQAIPIVPSKYGLEYYNYGPMTFEIDFATVYVPPNPLRETLFTDRTFANAIYITDVNVAIEVAAGMPLGLGCMMRLVKANKVVCPRFHPAAGTLPDFQYAMPITQGNGYLKIGGGFELEAKEPIYLEILKPFAGIVTFSIQMNYLVQK